VPEAGAGAGAGAAFFVGLGAAVRPLEDARELLFDGLDPPEAPLVDALADGVPAVVGGAAATRCTPVTASCFGGVSPAAHEAPIATALVTPTMTDVVFLTS
jgi:hypothetical protein